MPASKPYALLPIAETGENFADFAPYVAAIDDRGTVAFQAQTRAGGTGVFAGDGGPIREFTADISDVVRSHPTIDEHGAVSFYADLAGGGEGLLRVCAGTTITLAETGARFTEIGPLGPTVTRSGMVAFRACDQRGYAGIFTATSDGADVVCVARVGDEFASFEGLPVVTGDGAVVFRANLRGGGHGIYLRAGDVRRTIASTGDTFASLGRFPSANDTGTVAFSATLRNGGEGIFTVENGQLNALVGTADGFVSCRGVLVTNHGRSVFYATPAGGNLGIYTGCIPSTERVLGIGDSLLDASVAAFALNPVSINARGQLAIRVLLSDERQLLIRADPVL